MPYGGIQQTCSCPHPRHSRLPLRLEFPCDCPICRGCRRRCGSRGLFCRDALSSSCALDQWPSRPRTARVGWQSRVGRDGSARERLGCLARPWGGLPRRRGGGTVRCRHSYLWLGVPRANAPSTSRPIPWNRLRQSFLQQAVLRDPSITRTSDAALCGPAPRQP